MQLQDSRKRKQQQEQESSPPPPPLSLAALCDSELKRWPDYAFLRGEPEGGDPVATRRISSVLHVIQVVTLTENVAALESAGLNIHKRLCKIHPINTCGEFG